ncbi:MULTISPECIES: LytR C-terminal domain-containing protein [Streptomyces]|uniref:LytR C-terminal domain-containing protein n=1 Tax=Streptomyces luteosporeus TaxID=173856 RepID=A0ABN3TM08_9ACTN
MSMLTPPGMGGKYRITGNRFPHMRRPPNRRRIVLVSAAAAVVLGLTGWGTLQLVGVYGGLSGSSQDAAARTAAKEKKSGDCKPGAGAPPVKRADPKPLPKPGDITVNVYNATPRGGLAKITADELERRGFRIGQVGNAQADYDKKVPGTGVLVGSQAAADGALKVLGTQLAGTEVHTDEREGQDVDLVLGAGYQALAPKEEADKALTALESGQPAPAPSSPAPAPSSAPAEKKASPAAKC